MIKSWDDNFSQRQNTCSTEISGGMERATFFRNLMYGSHNSKKCLYNSENAFTTFIYIYIIHVSHPNLWNVSLKSTKFSFQASKSSINRNGLGSERLLRNGAGGSLGPRPGYCRLLLDRPNRRKLVNPFCRRNPVFVWRNADHPRTDRNCRPSTMNHEKIIGNSHRFRRL